MAKNPKSVNPEKPLIKTAPGQTLVESTSPKAYDLLPGVFRTGGNKKILDAFVENMFQPASLETLNFTVGRKTNETVDNVNLPHPTARRQLEAGLVLFTETGVETVTADDIAVKWGFNDRTQENPVPIAICDLPIDPDKFINWYDYYWLEEGMPALNVAGGSQPEYYDIKRDIIGSRYYTLPVQRNGRSLSLKNGMRLIFQQHPYQTSIAADEYKQYVSTGASIDSIDFELTGYNKDYVGVSINGELKVENVDYRIIGNEVHWITPPESGDNIYIALDDYYLTKDEYKSPRIWQVEGVGTEQGIRLLGITHQVTATIYSKVVQSKWDQTTIPWDRIEWDGDIQGINDKHYILQKVGAENRNAHSRVNVWYHRDTIQTLADHLDLTFEDIALNSARALRPILEFDNTLEMWTHGTAYRPWVNSVEKTQADPSYYLGKSVREANILLQMAKETTEDYKLNSAPRVLWLVDGAYQHKIINFRSTSDIVTEFFVEAANDGDAVVVQNSSGMVGLSFVEYYWKGGQALPANYRKNRTQQPLFELYGRAGIRLSDLENIGILPNHVNSKIVELISGDTYDSESGYKLKFSPSSFSELNDANIAKNPMYNILYKTTQQNLVSYFKNNVRKTYPGPYSFRRWAGGNKEFELSNGWKQAWFRLKSAAIRKIAIDSETSIPLDLTMWANYQWGVTINQGQTTFIHLDNYQPVVDNRAVVARGQPATFKLFLAESPDIQLVTINDGVTEFVTNVINGAVTFTVPTNATDLLTITIGTSKLTARVIDSYQDPRNPKVKLNGLDVDYSFDVTLSGNSVTAVNLLVNGEGSLEIVHQGNIVDDDVITAVPGMDLNPDQYTILNEFSVAKIIERVQAEISATKRKDQSWIDCLAVKSLNGIQMAEHSSMRAAWATIKLNPSLDELIISRSLAGWKWHRKFLNKLEELHNMTNLEAVPLENTVNRILEELLVGTTQSSVDAITGMAMVTSGMNVNLVDVDISTAEFDLPNTLSTNYYSADHVYVYLNGQLLIYITDYTLNETNNSVVLNIPAVAGDQIAIYHANEADLYTGIPASPAKLGLSAVYEPGFIEETWGVNSRKYIRRHDGTKITAYQAPDGSAPENYILNKLILELEKRIYNGITVVSGARERQLLVNNYSRNPLTKLQVRGQLDWYQVNNLDYRDRSDFVLTDPWTWNYNGKSWRAIYIDKFGTYNIHSAPWESLGYSIKPQWWDLHYSWTDATKRTALEKALQNGVISNPEEELTIEPNFRRSVSIFPVDSAGSLLDPVASAVVSAPGADVARQPWEIGSLGPYEFLWANSPAGAWSNVMHGLTNYNVVSEFFDSNIDPYAKQLHIKNYSLAPKGVDSTAPTQFFQDRPTLGLGAVLFEGNRDLNHLGETPLTDLISISVRIGFELGGFSDGNINIKLPFSRNGLNNYVPVEDTTMTLSEGVAVSQLRYSAVRLQKDTDGFRVFGFDPGQRYFSVFQPAKTSPSRNLDTVYGTFKEYQEWNATPVDMAYGSLLANKQEVLTFLMGLGEYQQSRGLVLGEVDAQGINVTWKQAAVDAFQWIEEGWGNSHYCIIGVATRAGIKFRHERGSLDDLSKGLGSTGKILFSSGRPALATEVLVTRNIERNTDNIQPLNDEQIVFADLSLRDFQHVVFINRKTKFNDTIVDSVTGNRVNSVKISARRTHAWTGRPAVNGAIPTETGILPSFEALATDIIKSRQPETSAFEYFKNSISRSNVVPAKDSVVSDIIQDDTNLFLYQQGVQTASGTNLTIDALFRNVNFDIPGKVQEIQVNEQWMFDVGQFGKTGPKKIWEIELRKEDFTGRRQIIRFNPDNSSIDLRSDNIIDLIGNKDPRWVTRPSDPNFRMIPRSEITVEYSKANDWLPSAGIAELTDTDLKFMSLDEFKFDDLRTLKETKDASSSLTVSNLFTTKTFSKFIDYKVGDYVWNRGLFYTATKNYAASTLGAFDLDNWQLVNISGKLLPSIWLSDFDGYGWNVLQIMPPVYVEEVCPNALDPNLVESKITFASPHQLAVGEKFILAGAGDSALDTLLTVKEIVDDYNLLVDAKSTSGGITYNLVAFKIKSVKFNSDAEWQASPINFIAGMKAYIDYGDTEGSWKVVTYVDDGSDVGTQPDIIVEYSGPMVASGDLSVVKLINGKTQEELTTLEIFDPYKGLTIDEAANYIDYKGIADPAIYNITDLGAKDPEAVEIWDSTQVGKLWWDLTSLRYIEYEQTDDIQYRATHWGEKYANTTVMVYEWVEADQEPTTEEFPYARLDKSSSMAGQIRYSEEEVFNATTGKTETKYYFWNGNVDRLNSAVPGRIYSANAIQSMLNDPDANGIAWMSPIDKNALLVSNINDFFAENDRLILQIELDAAPEQNFNFAKLVSEGFSGDVIDDFFYKRLEASIASRDNYREIYPIKPFVPGQTYYKGDYVVNFSSGTFVQLITPGVYTTKDYPLLNSIDDQREDITQIWQAIPGRDHRIFQAAKDFTASSSLSTDRNARKLIKSGAVGMISGVLELDLNEYYAVINTRRQVPSSRLHPARRYGNQIVPLPQSWFNNVREARRVLVSAANSFLLNIDTVSKQDWDKYLITYKPLFGPYTRNLTGFWRYADYVASGYVPGNEIVRLTDFSQVADLDDDITNFAIVDSSNDTIEAYDKDGNIVTLVYRKNGTIQFSNSLWNGALGDTWDSTRWDSTRWDEDGSEIIESILKALRYSIFVGADLGYFNLLFFALVKESLVQIPTADWVAKTTYLDVTQTSSNNLNQVKAFYNKKDRLVGKYIDEVKPYHTKTLDKNQFSVKVVPTSVDIAESIDLSVTTVAILVQEQDENAIVSTESGLGIPQGFDTVTQSLTEES
jgi:hypothetical protein